MDADHEIAKLKAELMAVQFMVLGLMTGIKRMGPQGELIIKEALRYADYATDMAVANLGGSGTGTYVTRIAEVVERLRASIVDDEGKPQSGI